MKNHLKRIASPRTWVISRKQNKFIVRPNPGAHAFDAGLPLGIIMRDILNLAETIGEVRKILNNKEVLVDGKRRKDHHYIVGLFDVLAIPGLKKCYRVTLDFKGRIIVKEIPEREGNLKVCKIIGKRVLPKGKVQFNLHDGKNIIADKEARVGDSFVLSLPKLEIKEVLTLKKGANVFLTKGKHSGGKGVLKEITGNEAHYTSDNKEIETLKTYLFVIGDKKPVIEL
jgi:small subunit ribosomal protein S4e